MRKGQKQPANTKALMIETKMNNHIVGMDASNATLPSGRDFIVPSHRKNKRFSSIDEYSSFLKINRWGVREFASNGYSKVQVGFFNFVLKGKMTISKEEFVRLYCGDFIELKAIAHQYGIPNEYMTFVREHFGIKRIGAKGLCRGRSELDFTDRQKQIVIGSLMGDGMVTSGGHFQEKHGMSQYGYLNWKFSELKEHCLDGFNIKIDEYYDDRYDKGYLSAALRTRNHRYFKYLRKKMYVNEVKCVPQTILDSIDELGLAVWYMDDGSVTFLFDEDDYGHTIAEVKLYTCSFTDDDNERIVKWLMDRWGIEARICYKKPGNINPYIYMYKESAATFLDLTRCYAVHPMEYKFDPYEWIGHRYLRGYTQLKNLSNRHFSDVITDDEESGDFND